jgi:hypothetical protein
MLVMALSRVVARLIESVPGGGQALTGMSFRRQPRALGTAP